MSPSPIYAARQQRGLSLRKLAAASGVHYTTLSRFEHGLIPGEAHLARLAAALKVPVSRLRGGN